MRSAVARSTLGIGAYGIAGETLTERNHMTLQRAGIDAMGLVLTIGLVLAIGLVLTIGAVLMGSERAGEVCAATEGASAIAARTTGPTTRRRFMVCSLPFRVLMAGA